MSSTSYKKLLTNLPSMAAIVNSFQSEQVQIRVYETLIQALENRQSDLSDEPGQSSTLKKSSSVLLTNGDVSHELVEGDSIHSIGSDD